MTRFFAIMAFLALTGCASVPRTECNSLLGGHATDSTGGTTVVWTKLQSPPPDASLMLAKIEATPAYTSKEPRQLLWYVGPSNRYRLYFAHQFNAEYFEFERRGSGYAVRSDMLVVCE